MDLQRLKVDEICEDNTGSIFLLKSHAFFNEVLILCFMESIDTFADGSPRFNFGINGKHVNHFTGIKATNALFCEFESFNLLAVEIHKFDFIHFDKAITLRIYEFLY